MQTILAYIFKADTIDMKQYEFEANFKSTLELLISEVLSKIDCPKSIIDKTVESTIFSPDENETNNLFR
jgi:hypothetical protein